MIKKCQVLIDKKAEKEMRHLPGYIAVSLRNWIYSVLRYGIYEVRKTPGYHDEPLYGARAGQRSVRLNRSYRLIYIMDENGEVMIIRVIEVNKHKY